MYEICPALVLMLGVFRRKRTPPNYTEKRKQNENGPDVDKVGNTD